MAREFVLRWNVIENGEMAGKGEFRMANVPKRVSDRLTKQVAVFQRVLKNAKDRDVNESDTVTIVTDMLAEVFGFDKYEDITSEQAIRGTFCDLAVKLEGKIRYLIEVKAIGLALRDNHLRQAIGYGANHGIPWVVLTNGIDWQIYRIRFERPLGHDLICSCNILEMSARSKEHQAQLFLLCREGLSKDVMEEYHEHVQVANRFVVGAILQTDPIIDVVRRELRRLSSSVKVEKDEIKVLMRDLLKRDVIEGEAAAEAISRVNKAASKALRKREKKSEPASPVPPKPENIG